MGMILNQYNLIPIIRRYRIYGAGILLLLLLAFYLPNRAICSGMCNVPYKDLYHLLSRCSVLFLGAVMSLAFISSIPITKIASKVGKHTLFIYCYHVFFVFHVVPNIWNQLGIIPCFIIVLIYSLFVFVVLALLSNIKVLNYIINPLR
jgi:fucose 4-O-acetylase-like acetyltransferase